MLSIAQISFTWKKQINNNKKTTNQAKQTNKKKATKKNIYRSTSLALLYVTTGPRPNTVGPVSLFGASSEAFAAASKHSTFSAPTITVASETISYGCGPLLKFTYNSRLRSSAHHLHTAPTPLTPKPTHWNSQDKLSLPNHLQLQHTTPKSPQNSDTTPTRNNKSRYLD